MYLVYVILYEVYYFINVLNLIKNLGYRMDLILLMIIFLFNRICYVLCHAFLLEFRELKYMYLLFDLLYSNYYM